MLVDEVELIVKNNGFNPLMNGDISVIPNMVDLVVEFVIAYEGFGSTLDEAQKSNIKSIVADLVFDKEFTKLKSLNIPDIHLSKILSASSVSIVKNEAILDEEAPAPTPVEPDSDPV